MAVAGFALAPWMNARAAARRAQRFMPLEKLSFHAFANHLNTSFRVATEDGTSVELDLIEAEQHAASKNPARGGATYERFSLVFAGPLQPRLPQKIYTFEHARLGRFEMFMVPILSRDPARMHYECVFNRLARHPAQTTQGQ